MVGRGRRAARRRPGTAPRRARPGRTPTACGTSRSPSTCPTGWRGERGQGRGHEPVARVRQRRHVLGQPEHEVVDPDRALVQDPAERRRLRQPAERGCRARSTARASGAPRCGVPRVTTSVTRSVHGSSASVATAHAARMTSPPMRVARPARSGVRRHRPAVDQPLRAARPARRRSRAAAGRCWRAGRPASSRRRRASASRRTSCPARSRSAGSSRTRSRRARGGTTTIRPVASGNASARPARSSTTSRPSTPHRHRDRAAGDARRASRSPIRPLTAA